MQVKKRNGRLEDFDVNKIRRSFVAAGVAPEETEMLTAGLEIWAEEKAEEGVVDSQTIWDKAVEILEAAAPEAAIKFVAYRKQTMDLSSKNLPNG